MKLVVYLILALLFLLKIKAAPSSSKISEQHGGESDEPILLAIIQDIKKYFQTKIKDIREALSKEYTRKCKSYEKVSFKLDSNDSTIIDTSGDVFKFSNSNNQEYADINKTDVPIHKDEDTLMGHKYNNLLKTKSAITLGTGISTETYEGITNSSVKRTLNSAILEGSELQLLTNKDLASHSRIKRLLSNSANPKTGNNPSGVLRVNLHLGSEKDHSNSGEHRQKSFIIKGEEHHEKLQEDVKIRTKRIRRPNGEIIDDSDEDERWTKLVSKPKVKIVKVANTDTEKWPKLVTKPEVEIINIDNAETSQWTTLATSTTEDCHTTDKSTTDISTTEWYKNERNEQKQTNQNIFFTTEVTTLQWNTSASAENDLLRTESVVGMQTTDSPIEGIKRKICKNINCPCLTDKDGECDMQELYIPVLKISKCGKKLDLSKYLNKLLDCVKI